MRRVAAGLWLALILTGCKLPTSSPSQLVVGKPTAPKASAAPVTPSGAAPASPTVGGQGVSPTTPNTPLLGPQVDLQNGIDQASGIIATGGGNLIGQAGGTLIGEAGGNLIGQAGGNLTQPPPSAVDPGGNLDNDIGDLVANVPDTDSPLDSDTDSGDSDDEESTESDEETAAAYRAAD